MVHNLRLLFADISLSMSVVCMIFQIKHKIYVEETLQVHMLCSMGMRCFTKVKLVLNMWLCRTFH